jgi:septal ring factor EnvC (AmiA/AmiB activator)
MFAQNELANLEKNIQRHRDQLAGKRNTLTTIAPEEKVRIQQQIDDLRSQISKLEQEYWEILHQRSMGLDFSDAEAEPIVAEWVEKANQLETNPPANVPAEILQQVQAVAKRLDQPGQSAAIKVKGMISALPPFFSVGIETELDVAGFVKGNFPTFWNWAAALAKK